VIPGSRVGNPATERFVAIQRRSSIGVQRANFRKKKHNSDRALLGGRTPRARVGCDVEAGSLMAGQSVGFVTREPESAEILENWWTRRSLFSRPSRAARHPPGASPQTC